MARPIQPPDFSPVKGIQPAQPITNFYVRPNMNLQVPEGNLSQLATSLQGLSPTLLNYIAEEAKEENETEAAEGLLAAQNLSAEERRDFLAGKFTKLEKDGTIPVGASPFRIAAMQEFLGRDIVRTQLATTLTNNVGRLSDPMSEEDPSEFVQQQWEELGIQNMNFYAQKAAMRERDSVERAFLNQVGQRKASQTAKRNSDNLESDIYRNIEKIRDSKPGEEQISALGEMRETLNNAYKKYGSSGAEETLRALKLVVLETAEDDPVEAIKLIELMRKETVGKSTLDKRYAADLGELEDKVDDIFQSAEIRRDRLSRKAQNKSQAAAETAANRLYDESGDDPRIDWDSSENRERIAQELRALGVSEDLMPQARARVTRSLKGWQEREESDADALKFMDSVIADPNINHDSAVLHLESWADSLSVLDYRRFSAAINKSRSEDSVTADLLNGDSNNSRMRQSAMTSSLDAMDVGVADSMAILSEWVSTEDRIAREVAKLGLPRDEAEAEYTERINKAFKTYSENLENVKQAINATGGPQALPRNLSPVMGRIAEETQRGKVEAEKEPGVLTEEENFFSVTAERSLEKIQHGDNEFQVATARTAFLRQSIREFNEYAVEANEEGGLDKDDADRALRFKAFGNGFDLKEIKDQQIFGSSANPVSIPSEILNPRFVILLPGLRNEKQFEDFTGSEKGQKYIKEVMRSIPGYQADRPEDVKRFVEQQMKVFLKYRPSRKDAEVLDTMPTYPGQNIRNR